MKGLERHLKICGGSLRRSDRHRVLVTQSWVLEQSFRISRTINSRSFIYQRPERLYYTSTMVREEGSNPKVKGKPKKEKKRNATSEDQSGAGVDVAQDRHPAESLQVIIVPCKGSHTRLDDWNQHSDDAEELHASSEPADFESLYLQQATREFADDIDKLRKAGDFTDRSVPILVDALKQGAHLFSEEDKKKLMRGRASG